MNELELYCGLHSNSFSVKKCPQCKKEYKYYAGTVAYTFNKLQFCSYNCREKYKKPIKSQLEQEALEQERLELERLEHQAELSRIRSTKRYKKLKDQKEFIKKLKNIDDLPLTEKEKQVLYGIKYNKTNIKIAEELDISPQWVSQIKITALKKLLGDKI